MNLITDPLLRVDTEEGRCRMSLPGLMAALGRDAVHHLPGVQRHQEDAFHVFLCFLAGAVLNRHGDENPAQTEAYWRRGLRSLAGDAGDDAWTLIVEDLSLPGFMQPSLPDSDWARLKPLAHTADEMDMLVTAKNHDVKRARGSRFQPDQWVYALVSLQTMSGYYGPGNHGISRMNGGFGSRCIVELVGRHTPGGRWRDAVVRLLDHRREVLQAEYGYDDRGLVLVWLEPWDGSSSLKLSSLDPFYIEICRRVRLRDDRAVVRADSVPTRSNRIAAKELKGMVGDPWLPVNLGSDDKADRRGTRALTVSPRGLTSDLLRRLVFEDRLQLSLLQKPLEEWEGVAWLNASVLVRGQGRTDGFHESRIPLPSRVRRVLFESSPQRDRLQRLSRTSVDYAGKMNGVLRRALLTHLQGGSETPRLERDTGQPWSDRSTRRFESLWSKDYFPWLWSVPEDFDEEETEKDWCRQLRDHALLVLREAQQSMPVPSARRFRSQIQAERAFWYALYSKNNFPFLKEE